MPPDTTRHPRTIMEQIDEVSDIAREAFAVGNNVTGIAATKLAAQLVQIARLMERAP